MVSKSIGICEETGGGKMKNIFKNTIIEPCLCSCNNIITEVNKEFTDLTGFNMDELVGK